MSADFINSIFSYASNGDVVASLVELVSTSATVSFMLFTSFLTIAFIAGNSILYEYVNSTVLSDKLESISNAIKTSTGCKRLLELVPSTDYYKILTQQQQQQEQQQQQHKYKPQKSVGYALDDDEQDALVASTSATATTTPSSGRRTFRRCMTSIGRFSLQSQTERNPCVVTFFVGLSNKKDQKEITKEEFNELWKSRVMNKHQRFRSCICPTDDRYFEVTSDIISTRTNIMDRYVTELSHPTMRDEFLDRIHEYCTTKMDVSEHLWEAQISTGPMGSSGAIRNDVACRNVRNGYDRETVALFRVHHALCDGVSLSVAVGDACDEHDELNDLVMSELNIRHEKKKTMSTIQRIMTFIKLVIFYVFGTIVALSLQFWRMMVGINPFDKVIELSSSSSSQNIRSTTWKYIAPIKDAKQVTKRLSKSATLNDMFTVCVTAALKRQLDEHKNRIEANGSKHKLYIPSHLNITVPVHLYGGVLLPGQSLGNKIGAFVTAIPVYKDSDMKKSGKKRLQRISSALMEGKCTTASLIAWASARIASTYAPLWVSKFMMRNGSAKSVAVVSNCKGFPFVTHWNGRKVEFLSAFLPLPPGIPIGFVLQSYNDELSFTIEADARAIPDADEFANWVVEEYVRLKDESHQCQ